MRYSLKHFLAININGREQSGALRYKEKSAKFIGNW